MIIPGHIYIIHEREFIRLNEDVYKIGRTKNLKQRVRDYPKGSNLIFCYQVNDIIETEKKILDRLRSCFINRRDIGLEYFEGNKQSISNIVLETISDIHQTINQNTNNSMKLLSYSNKQFLLDITDEDYKRYIISKEDGICMRIKDCYFNPNLPEGRNIITTPTMYKNNEIMIYKDNKWIVAKCDEILERLILGTKTALAQICIFRKSIPLTQEELSEYTRYFNSINHKDIYLQEKIGIVILNNSEQVHT